MQCGTARKYLYGLDKQTVAISAGDEVAQARAHVAGCAACQEFFAAEERLKAFLKTRAQREKSSATLREQVLNRIALEREKSVGLSRWFGQMSRRSVTLALLGLLLIIAFMGSLWLKQRQGRIEAQPFASILIDDHTSNLSDSMEITSSDREAIQKWFRERVGLAFRLPVTSDPQLIGGRLCYLQGRRGALILYQHPHSKVSLFISDGSDVDLSEEQLVTLDGKRCLLDARKGYNVVLWKERGLLYGLVSDVRSADLLQLAGKF